MVQSISPVTSTPWLDADACQRIREGLGSLRRLWHQRRAGCLLYTVGASIYKDAQDLGFEGYLAKARSSNLALRGILGWFYEELEDRLCAILGGTARFHPDLALPGFHVMLADETFLGPFADIHFDTQYQLVDYGRIGLCGPADFSEGTIRSITIPVALPASGGGMYHWDLDKNWADGRPADEIRAGVREDNRRFYAYAEGNVVTHSGLYYHQIAKWRRIDPGDERVTLQAHAFRDGDDWIVYW